MKILKYLLFIVIGLVLIFFVIGFINPSVGYGYEISVDKPLKEAWAVLQDESKYSQWLKGYKSMELISGEEGAIGSKYKVIVNPGNDQPDFEMIQTLVAMEEFDHVKLSYDSEMMDFEQKYTFSETDGKATVKSDAQVKGKGMMTRSMFALMEIFGNAFQAQETENMEALKRVIEENTTDYYPEPKVITDETVTPDAVPE